MEKNHLDKFEGQCSLLLPERKYADFMEGRNTIGYLPTDNDPQGSMFVSTSKDMDRLLSESNGDIAKIEKSLGLPEGHFGNGPIVRVDVHNPENHGLRMANGREAGANEFFNTPTDSQGNLPHIEYTQDQNGRWCVDTQKTNPEDLARLNGQYWDQNGVYHAPKSEGYAGKTSAGFDEAVVNCVPNYPENVSYTLIDGFKRGEDSKLETSKIENGYAPESYQNSITSSNIASVNGGGARAPNATQNSRDIDVFADLGLTRPSAESASKSSGLSASAGIQ